MPTTSAIESKRTLALEHAVSRRLLSLDHKVTSLQARVVRGLEVDAARDEFAADALLAHPA
jgi:hypothetical protein